MYSLMSIWMSASWLPNICIASCLASLGLADAGGADEHERADGAARVLEVGAGTAEGAGNGAGGELLADDVLLDLEFESEQLLALLLPCGASGMPVQSATTCIIRSSSMDDAFLVTRSCATRP